MREIKYKYKSITTRTYAAQRDKAGKEVIP